MDDRPTPRRAIVLDVVFQADNRDELQRAVESFLFSLDDRQAPSGCCGGNGYGWTYEMSEAEHPTAEEYAALLQQWSDSRRN